MCWMRSVASKTQAQNPLRVFSIAFQSCASRSSWKSHACSRNAFSSITRSLSAQVAGAVENARLFQRAQARAERERVVAEITDQVRTSPEVDSILRTAIGELGRALRASEGWIRLDVADESGSPEPPAQPPSWGQN